MIFKTCKVILDRSFFMVYNVFQQLITCLLKGGFLSTRANHIRGAFLF